MKRISAIIISIFILFPLYISAQSVGVVMSGGGAKGLYHIGVLRALEENGIPIDYISGTSMGSIVGALYASGYTIEEMEQIALSGDLERWVSGRVDAKYHYFYLERDRMTSMIRIPIRNTRGLEEGSRYRVQLPGSMMNTAEIDLALNSFFAQPSTAANGDFDNLMIPYRCIATEISQHRAVELKSGDLPRAIRASMALPVAFPPVEIDSVLMCDGGCYDNFPWRSLDESFHPDILIGICCTSIDQKLDTNASVVEQVITLITKPSDFDMPSDRSIFIQRAVEASVLDFGRSGEIMAAGYNDAIEAMPKIKQMIKRRMSAEEFKARRKEFRERCPRPYIGEVEIEGLNAKQQDMVRRMMNMSQYRNADTLPTHAQELSDNFLSLLARGVVHSNFPSFTYNRATERYDVTLPLTLSPNFDVSVGGNISSTAFNQAYIGLQYGWWGRVEQALNLDILLGPIYTMARLKGRTTLIHESPIYFDYSLNFNIHNTLYGNFGNLTAVDNAEQMRMMELFFSGAVGSALRRRSIAELRVNGGRNSYMYALEGYNKRQYTHFTYVTPSLSVERSTLNKPLFPTEGSHLTASAIYVYGRDRRSSPKESLSPTSLAPHVNMIRAWYGMKVSWKHYVNLTRNKALSLGYAIEGVYTNHPEFDSPQATSLSSPHYAPLLHSQMIYMPEFRANRYLGIGVMPTARLYDNLYLRLSLYGMLRDVYNGERMHYMSDLSLIYHTPIGPISLALTKYDFRSPHNLYLTFNFGYAIFGRKGLHY